MGGRVEAGWPFEDARFVCLGLCFTGGVPVGGVVDWSAERSMGTVGCVAVEEGGWEAWSGMSGRHVAASYSQGKRVCLQQSIERNSNDISTWTSD